MASQILGALLIQNERVKMNADDNRLKIKTNITRYVKNLLKIQEEDQPPKDSNERVKGHFVCLIDH